MLKRVVRGNGQFMLCGTCMDARGVGPDELVEEAETSNMTELANAIAAADQLLVF